MINLRPLKVCPGLGEASTPHRGGFRSTQWKRLQGLSMGVPLQKPTTKDLAQPQPWITGST